MNSRRTVRSFARRSRRNFIGTTFLELIQELSKLTSNDHLVVAAVKDICRNCDVRFGPRLVPVKVVGNARRPRARL